MELKPGYKQTEVGIIPEDWDTSNLESISLVPMQNGLFYEPKRKGRGVYLVNVGDMYTAAPISIETLDLFDATTSQIQTFCAQEGDLFFTRSSVVPSGIAYCNILPDCKGADVVFDSHLIRVRANPNIMDARFLYLNCLAMHSRKYLVSSAKTATMTTIDQGALKKCPVFVPPLSEQRAIATALSDVDALLEGLDRLIAKKRDLKQAAMQQLLTGKTRLPGFKGEWEVKRLGDIIEKLVGGGTPSRGNQAFWGNEIPWVTVKDFATFHPRQTQESITKIGLNNSASHLIPAGTLITSTRMALGKAVVYEVDVAINQDLKAIFLKPTASVQFLYYWFEHNAQMIDELGSGSTVKGISINELRGIPFPHLPLSEQTAIATVLSDMDAEIAALENRRNKTKDIKQAMMQELLTGKTRLVKIGGSNA